MKRPPRRAQGVEIAGGAAVLAPGDLGIGLLFWAVHEAVIVADAETELIVLWNPAAEAMFGYTADEAVGQPVEIVTPERLRPAHRAGMARYRETGHGKLIDTGRPIEVPALKKSGEELFVELSLGHLAATPDGRRYVLAIIRDVSERKDAEIERERLQAERIAALEQMDAFKDQFLSILSHELRTPLNAVLGFASILDDEVHGPLNPDQRQDIQRILASGDALLALVNDLLDMSRIQAGKFTLTPAPCSFPQVVKDALVSLVPLAERKKQRLLNEVPEQLPVLEADEQRLEQVLLNLVGNAIKFTQPGGSIRVGARVEGGSLRCEVTDTGPGIAPGDEARLFKPFSQLDMSRTRSQGGAGLGLSICKALVEAHGGTIGVESVLGVGATFWFTLPLKP